MSDNQLSRDQLKTMKPDEILQAQKDGRLKDILGGGDPTKAPAGGMTSGVHTMSDKDFLARQDKK